jgi:hypothetical protein
VTCITCHGGATQPSRQPRPALDEQLARWPAELAAAPESLKLTMSVYSVALGVGCDHCHLSDWKARDKPALQKVALMSSLFELFPVGLTIVTAPGGAPVHVDATIQMTTLSGNWVDSAGNRGPFTFTPGAGVGGDPRPVPSGGLAPGSVTMTQLAPGSVGTAQVADGSLTSTDILDAPLADYSGGDDNTSLVGYTVLRVVVLPIPDSGMVIANASGTFDLISTTRDHVECSITTGTAVETSNRFEASDNGHEAGRFLVPFAGTRGFFVTRGTTFTVRLVCRQLDGAVAVKDSNLTAIFVGNR